MNAIEHPAHYQGSIECIKIIECMTEGKRGLEAFCIGNAVKYLYRYRQKGKPVEDLKKAVEYINMIISEEEKKR